ncbi:MAG: hypothetical protein EA367_06165 [Leptolyngbya sp. DLM2.Bin15]|nr:MAG: hypothetical protein EA367_06165 [Leptolyngbya sp. DLM2.Bin15]
MIDDNLIQLSFEQLEEIQSRISQVISEKRSARISDAIKDVLNLLNTHYADVSLWEFLNELADAYQGHDLTSSSVAVALGEQTMAGHDLGADPPPHPWLATDSGSSPLDPHAAPLAHHPPEKFPEPGLDDPLEESPAPHHSPLEPGEDCPVLLDPGIFYERLRVIRNEVLQHEEARLIWLTNDGSQKTSKVSGRALAELLQETIKKLERLCETDAETGMKVSDLNREVLRISEWSELHLGVSLRKGTLTVITPFAARDLPVKGYSPMLTIADMQQQASKGDLHIPFSPSR